MRDCVNLISLGISLHFAVKFCIRVSFIFPLCELKEEASSLSFNRSRTDTGPHIYCPAVSCCVMSHMEG